jgi:cell division protein FtsQ
MTEPNPPAPDHVPDHVLDELLDAFSEDSAPQYNFDDPSIDRLLGITDEHAAAHNIDDEEIDDDDEIDDEIDDHIEIDDDIDVDEADVDEQAAGRAAAAVGAADAGEPRRIIVIAEDDRPDSVYLDEDKEKAFHQRHDVVDESGERSTIVIADLDGAGASEPPTANSRAGIDPRIRARRISVRRAEGRRRLIWTALGITVVLLAVGVIAVFASPVFDVREVTVQGAVYTDADVLASVIDDLRGEPVLLVDTVAAEERLETVPWVESARVSTDFPHTVVIDIRERRPVAAFQGGDQRYRVIDAEGRVLDVLDGQPADYLLITGDHPDTARGQFAGAPYASVAGLVVSLPSEIRAATRTVGVDAATGTLTLVLEGDDPAGVLVRLGDDNDLDEKLARLLKQVRSGLADVCQLDVSTADAGVVPC